MSIIKKKATKTVTGYNIGPNQAFVDPQEVFKLAALGCTDKEIADWFEITTKLLNDDFKSELSKGRAGSISFWKSRHFAVGRAYQ